MIGVIFFLLFAFALTVLFIYSAITFLGEGNWTATGALVITFMAIVMASGIAYITTGYLFDGWDEVQAADCDRVITVDDVRYIAEDCIDAR